MDKRFIPVAMLAGALALAGCGGGSDTPAVGNGGGNGGGDAVTPETLDGATAKITACTTAACVDGVVTGAAGDLTAAELATLRAAAETKKAEIAAGTPLTGLNVSAANQLADALAGSEALQLGSRHIDTSNAEPRGNVPWKDHETAGLPGGWREPNPEGSSGEEQDMRVWTENPKHISEKYEDFFATGFTDKGVTAAPAPVNGAEGVLILQNVNDSSAFTASEKEALPSNFFTSGWTYSADVFPDATAQPGWELRGSFHGVPGKFVCADGLRCGMQRGDFNDDGTVTEENVSDSVGDFTKPSLPLGTAGAAAGIRFVPSNFDSDETDVPALFAEKANPDFLSFGVYWTTVIDDGGKVTALRVDPFAGGGVPYTTTEDIVLSGTGNVTANYSGSAAGTYVRTIVNADNDREATGYGGFSADANLTAVFGNSADALKGTISDFKLRGDQASAGAAPHASWVVKLGGDDGVAIKAGVVNTDSFHAQFHGAEGATRQSNGHGFAPYGLVGTFEHSFGKDDPAYGYVAGAFGAECDGGNCVRND